MLLQDVERRGRAAFLIGPTGAVIAASASGETLLAAQPELRAHLEHLGSEPSGATCERAIGKLGMLLTLTKMPTVGIDLRLIMATALADDDAESLTARQCELLELVGNGLTNREIGAAMGISEATVKTMLQRLYERTGTSGRIELVQWRRARS